MKWWFWAQTWKINITCLGKECLEWCSWKREQHDERHNDGNSRVHSGHLRRPQWLECVCSLGPFVPCWCLSRVTVCLFPSPAGFAPSFLATEVFSMCWSVTTTRETTSISGSGALMPRPSRCRVSAGSSSEQGDPSWVVNVWLSGTEVPWRLLHALSSASPCNSKGTQHPREPVHACTVSTKN